MMSDRTLILLLVIVAFVVSEWNYWRFRRNVQAMIDDGREELDWVDRQRRKDESDT